MADKQLNYTAAQINDSVGKRHAHANKEVLDGITSSNVSTWNSAIPSSAKGSSGGVAELDSNGKVPSTQLPSYVDDVLEYDNIDSFPETGESGKLYLAKNTNNLYRWTGTQYVAVSSASGGLQLGETSSTAYRGDRGKSAYDHSQLTSGNPHNVSKSDLSLGNVDNTSDETKKAAFKTAYTGSIASGNTGFVTGGDVYTAIGNVETLLAAL